MMLTTKDVANLTRISESYLRRLRTQSDLKGKGPPYYTTYINTPRGLHKSVVYKRSEVITWMRQRQQQTETLVRST